jgi:large subunit ribosomal protein L13
MTNTKIIIDGKEAVFGRLASFSAKKALEGNEIIILNSEKVIMTGNKKDLIKKYSELRKKGGNSRNGPKYTKIPYKMLKRGIRGMLPDHRAGIGKQAFLRIKCHDGIPEEFKEQKMMKISAPPKNKFITLKELAEKI